jgi:hypothetical protein
VSVTFDLLDLFGTSRNLTMRMMRELGKPGSSTTFVGSCEHLPLEAVFPPRVSRYVRLQNGVESYTTSCRCVRSSVGVPRSTNPYKETGSFSVVCSKRHIMASSWIARVQESHIWLGSPMLSTVALSLDHHARPVA